MTSLAQLVTDQGDLLCASAVAVAAAVWAWVYLGRLTATAFILSFLLTATAGALLKLISVQFAPPVQLAPIFTFSEGAPSGHVALATVLYGSAALFAGMAGRGLKVRIIQALCLAVIAAVAVTRVTLHYHTVPDALAGLALGAVGLVLPFWVMRRQAPDEEPRPARLIGAMLLVGGAMLASGLRLPSTAFL